MPQQFMDDPNVALKWKLYGYLNGFWLAGKPVYARNDTIAKQFGKAERSVQEALSELEKMGLITRDVKGLSRYILPGGIKAEGRGPASPQDEAQPHGATRPSLTIVHIDNADMNSSVAIAPPVEEVVVSFSEEEGRVRKPAKYPKAREVFSWFPEPEPSWKINTTECKHAELLYLRGESAVRGILAFLEKHQDVEDCPQVLSPHDLETKWNRVLAFAKRNGL